MRRDHTRSYAALHPTTGRVPIMTETGDTTGRPAALATAWTAPVPTTSPPRDGRFRPGISDLLVCASYTGPALATAIIFDVAGTNGTGLALPLIAAIGSGIALLFRRRTPMVSLAVTAGIMVLTFSIPASFAAVATAMALFAVSLYRSARHAALGLLGTSASLLAAAMLLPGSMDLVQAVQATALLVIATLIGLNVRTRRDYLTAVVDRADRLSREREHLAGIAAAAERNAIAREMHDIVSHGLAVMISLAHGSAEIAPTDPARAVHAMRQVAETGRVAVADMRRLLGVLDEGSTRGSAGALAPSPGTADLPDLVELFGSAGLPVVLRSAGVPPADSGIQLVIYRVIQEGLTNALKYARAATAVTVNAQYSEQEISISVTDDGQHRLVPSDHAGRGIVGMRERVTLYGGTFDAGALAGHGWSVTARFPPQNGAPWLR